MKLRVQNFQSIKDYEFEFDSLTSIVGPTDRGKSAIERALRSLFFNEWEEGFLRRDTKKCILTATFPEGYPISQIIQEKGKSINRYTIKFSDGRKDKVIPKAGIKVPDEIKQLGFDIIETERGDKFNLNFHGQYDSLFLVAQSDPLVTSFFNHIFKVTKYERALRKMSSDLIKLNQGYTSNEEKLEAKKEELDIVTHDFNLTSVELELIKKLVSQYDAFCEDIKSYDEGILKLITINSLVEQIDLDSKRLIDLEGIINLIEVYKYEFEVYFNISDIILQFKDINKDIYLLSKNKLKLINLNDKVNEYLNIFVEYGDISININNLIEINKLVDFLHYRESNVLEVGQILNIYVNEFEKLLDISGILEYYSEINFNLSRLQSRYNYLLGVKSIIESILLYENELTELYTYRERLGLVISELFELENTKKYLVGEESRIINYDSLVRSIFKICPTCNSILSEVN